MNALKKCFTASLVSLFLSHGAALAADISFTWDGKYITDPSQIPEGFLGQAPGPSPAPSYAKVAFKAQTTCAVKGSEDSTKLILWEQQPHWGSVLAGDDFSCVAEPGNRCDAGTTAVTADAQNAMISFNAYMAPGTAYAFSGYQVCYVNDGRDRRCGGNAAEFPKCHVWSAKVEIPPVLYGIAIRSNKQYKSFNTFKAGETLYIDDVRENVTSASSSFLLPIKKTLIVEGPGIPQSEYDLTNWDMHESLTALTPTSTGMMRFKLRTQGYTYYYDHWHGSSYEDWNRYDWNKLYPNPTYTEQALYSTDDLCDKIFDQHQMDDPSDDERCSGYGQPKYHAELFTLESEWLEIPVTDDWCVIKRSEREHIWDFTAQPSEGCHACSSSYREDRPFWEDDPCANSASGSGDGDGSGEGSPDRPSTPGDGDGDDGDRDGDASGCSAAGASLPSAPVLLALFPALRRRRS